MRTEHATERFSVAPQKRNSSGDAPAPKPSCEKGDKTLPQLNLRDIKFDPTKDEIGEGSFGRVHNVDMLGTCVVYKVCKLGKREMGMGFEKVITKEVRIHASMHHPNIVQLLDINTDNTISLVCEYISQNLEAIYLVMMRMIHLIWSRPRKIYMIIQYLQDLTYLHAIQVVHADLTPANVLVSQDINVVMGLSPCI